MHNLIASKSWVVKKGLVDISSIYRLFDLNLHLPLYTVTEMSTYQKVVLAKRPTGDIIPGETFKLERAPVPSESDLKDGQVLLEARYLSLDPAMRGWLNGSLAPSHQYLTTTETLLVRSLSAVY